MAWKAFFCGLMLAAGPVAAQTTDEQWARIQKEDAEQRAKNAETDFWFVSSNGEGLKQRRFYVDRNHLTNSQEPGTAYGWIDLYEVLDAKRPIRLVHTKMLMEATCSGDSKIHFRTATTWAPDGTARSSSAPAPWLDVVPGTSMETLHRFVCHDVPANALYPIFREGETPEKDAMAYFAKQPK